MRATIVASTLPLLALAACGGGGGGVMSAGSGTAGYTPSPTPTPTPAAGAHLFDVTAATKFDAIGAANSLTLNKDRSELYTGNAATVDKPTGTITYNPRDGIFNLVFSDSAAGLDRTMNFQDPAHRSAADVAHYTEFQVPLLSGYNYLQALDGPVNLTFFYQRPGTSGMFVSLAGFERSEVNKDSGQLVAQQGALVFGAKTDLLAVPTAGTGHYDGQFLATMSASGGSASALQWLSGTSSVDVNFGKRTLDLSLAGTVSPAYQKALDPDTNLVVTRAITNLGVPTGATFAATGSASWTSGNAAFTGKFSSASFSSGKVGVPIDFTPVNPNTSTAGASSIDGTFYGAKAQNVGGDFRIVGGIPDQRVDILGAFAGAKK